MAPITHRDVLLYIPNIIGYSRIIFACLAFYYMFDSYVLFFIFYSLSAILDIADGHAARAFNQCSKFGAVLDMVTDRASTSCLIVVLSVFYPKYLLFYQFLIALDIMSHFAHIFSSLSHGAASHKTVRPDQNFLIKIYYTNRFVLGFLCWGNESFFIMLYVLHFWAGPLISLGPLAPLASMIFGSAELEFIKVLAFFFFCPIMAVKQFMNVVQLRQACIDIIELDVRDALSEKKKN